MIANNNPNLYSLIMRNDSFLAIPIIGFIYVNESMSAAGVCGNIQSEGWVLDYSSKCIHILNHTSQGYFSLDGFLSGITPTQKEDILIQLPV